MSEKASSSSKVEMNYVTRKGGTVLLYNGHQYYKNSIYKSGSELWRCSLYKKLKCTGFITIKDVQVIKEREHISTCTSDHAKNEVDFAMSVLKENVQKSDRPIPRMYNEVVAKLQDSGIDMISKLPEFRNVQHGLYKARNENLGVRKIVCENAECIEIPQKFTDFILADYCYEGNRIILCCSQKTKGFIHEIKEFFFDATYKSCPRPFYQLFTIHGEIRSSTGTTNVVPLLYVLMCDKKQSSYEIVFQLIKSQVQWNPTKLHCDFELAAINAVTKLFPYVSIIGCYYHWTQCMWRKAKSLGYTNTSVERRIVSLCAAIPLVPKEMTVNGWQYIKDEALSDMTPFFQYVEKNWINSKHCEIISVFGERHRTNNSVEAWNSKLNRSVNKNTVNLLRLLNILEDMEKETQIKFLKNQTNKQTNKRQREYKIRDDAIRQIQLDLINHEITLGHALEKLRR